MIRVLVCGGRDFNNIKLVRRALSVLPPEAILVHGGARGADEQCAEQWERWGGICEAHPADWNTHGKRAGVLRNQEMLETGVDLVVAFPGGKGTLDMVSRARKAGVEVVTVG